jgi:hypothetical protein
MLAISLLNMGEAAEGDDQGMSKIDGLAIWMRSDKVWHRLIILYK